VVKTYLFTSLTRPLKEASNTPSDRISTIQMISKFYQAKVQKKKPFNLQIKRAVWVKKLMLVKIML